MTSTWRPWACAGLFLVASLLLAACAGHQWASPADLGAAVAGEDSLRHRLLLQWRVPRVLAAALVGALLGLSGAIFQGVFRNPLAEPYLLGASGGAALGATVALLIPMHLLFGLPQSLTLPALAFAGAWGSTVLVLAVARVAGALDAAGMLLAGVALAAMLGALRSFLMLALSDETVSLQVVLSWVLGGIQTPSWGGLGLLAGASAACLAVSLALARGLDLLGLGDRKSVV